ncbi:MAG TPA: zinc-binding dehydrogenase, partial [Candidatus Paceibacterota bacterium]|nr:zinc-binding dehydrogenase [Candidatus Paceibacterota bacterium]
DIHDHKRATALEVGADLYINAATQSLRDELEKNLGLKEVHVIVDCTGSKKAIEDSLQLLSGIGRFVMLGHPKPGESIEIKNANHFFEGEGKLLRATQGGRFSPTRDIPRYVALHRNGRLNIDKIITHRYKLHEINEAIDQVRKGNASRILIEMQ